MNLEKVFFGFFIVLALTLNVAFVIGDIGNPEHHSIWILFAAVVVNLIATVLKLWISKPNSSGYSGAPASRIGTGE